MLKEVYQIMGLMQQVSDLWDKLTPEEQQFLNDMHNEQYTLGYCTRWGTQAAEECFACIADYMDANPHKNFKVGKNQIYLDKMAGAVGEYIVEKFEFVDDYKGKATPQYSVVDGFDMLSDAVECAMKA